MEAMLQQNNSVPTISPSSIVHTPRTQTRGKRAAHIRDAWPEAPLPHNLDLSFAAAADSDAETPMLGGATQQWSITTQVEVNIQHAEAQPTRIPSPARATTPPHPHKPSRIPSPARTQSPARKGLFGCLSPTRRTAAVACMTTADDGETVTRYGHHIHETRMCMRNYRQGPSDAAGSGCHGSILARLLCSPTKTPSVRAGCCSRTTDIPVHRRTRSHPVPA